MPTANRERHCVDPQERARRTAELFQEAEAADSRRRTEILHEVAELNVAIARSLARRYRGRGEPIDDLEQAACVGLMKAVNGYRTDRERDFLMYAVPTILGELKKHFRDHCWTVRPTRRIQELNARVVAATADLSQSLRREPSVAEIAYNVGEDIAAVEEVRTSHGCWSPLSLDAPLSTEGPDQSPTLTRALGCDEAGYQSAEASAMLVDAVRMLPKRHRRILWMRYFEDLTQREIAAEIGTTQMQVSRLLTTITAQLRSEIIAPITSAPASLRAAR
jgi:RNA polymerase sigma-B factor